MAGNAMLSTMEKLIEARDKNPNGFIRRITEDESKQGITPLDVSPPDRSAPTAQENEQKAQANARKLAGLKEGVDNNDEDGFANWKGQVYNFQRSFMS